MAASDWIKVRTVLPSDGRLRIASRKCHVSTVTVFGALVTLWCLADSHAEESGMLVGYTAADIDALVEVPGFCAALPADWIDLTAEYVKLPEYQEHNGTTGKSRSMATKRQKKHRDVTDVSRTKRDTSVTRLEKKREEKKEEEPAEIIPLDGGSDFIVTKAMAGEWSRAYPRIDVLGELRKARAWCLSNEKNRKTRSGASRFLNSWLSRANDDAASKPTDKSSLPGGGRRAL
jgi:hypothetical protein